MTKDQYHQAVLTHDRRMIEAMIDRMPSNINRAGRHYRKLVKEIKQQYGRK